MKVASGQLKARTLDEYARLLDCYVMPELGHVPIAAVTPAQLEQLIGALATDGKRTGWGRPAPEDRQTRMARRAPGLSLRDASRRDHGESG